MRKNGNNQPVEGKVIGHIIDGKFVPKEKLKITVLMKNFGDYEIAKSVMYIRRIWQNTYMLLLYFVL
ncbi:hypothetical protein H0I36_03425 [Mycoplasmopsis bovis]|nr:hypothetical protein H0I36_03425 [Mycoplasmopsis bovis]